MNSKKKKQDNGYHIPLIKEFSLGILELLSGYVQKHPGKNTYNSTVHTEIINRSHNNDNINKVFNEDNQIAPTCSYSTKSIDILSNSYVNVRLSINDTVYPVEADKVINIKNGKIDSISLHKWLEKDLSILDESDNDFIINKCEEIVVIQECNNGNMSISLSHKISDGTTIFSVQMGLDKFEDKDNHNELSVSVDFILKKPMQHVNDVANFTSLNLTYDASSYELLSVLVQLSRKIWKIYSQRQITRY